jgi:adenylate kinase family enzyme
MPTDSPAVGHPTGAAQIQSTAVRVSVVGPPGSGKSTLTRALAESLTAPLLELDSIYHQPGWQPLADDEFQRRVAAFITADRWVIDGNYSAVRPIIWRRAQVVVWLDLPTGFVLRRLVRRTLRRGVRQTELWNGNRESLASLLRRDEQQNLLLYAWRHRHKYRDRYSTAMADPSFAHIRFVRIRRHRDVEVDRVLAVLAEIREQDPNIGRTGG